MTRDRAVPRAVDGARRFALPLLCEIGVRAFRLPLFPGFAPLLAESRVAPRLAYAAALLAVELVFLGSGAWELVVACGMAAPVVQQRRWKFLPLTIVAAASWVLLGVATRSLGVGSFGLETLLTAVLMRVTGSEVLAGALARLLLAALVYGSVLLMGLLSGPLARLVPAMLALLLMVNGCGDRERTAFQPEPAGPGETVRIDFVDAAAGPAAHPVLAADRLDNAQCLACHRAKLGPTDLPLARKGFHEIHYEIVRIAPACTSCHAGAGQPGFPGLYPEERARHGYNQTCAGCHSGADGPRWARSIR